MANLLQYTGGAKAQGNPPETWTAPTSLFDTQDRADSGAGTFATATSRWTAPTGGHPDCYILKARYEYHDTSNGRLNPQGRFALISGTGNLVTATTGGYNRDNSEDRSYVETWAVYDQPSDGATVDFQWKADTDDSTGGTERSTYQVTPFYYSNIGMYTSTSAALYGGTTPNQVTGFAAVRESDTAAIEMVSNVVTVKGDNKRYIALGGQFFEGRGGRTQRWHGFRIDGTKDDSAKAYSYYRNTANDESGDIFSKLIDRVTTDITIDQFCYRGDGVGASQGGADADGSTPGVGAHAIVVLELNDSAEVFYSSTNADSANLATTGPVDLSLFPSANFNSDSASFTRVSDTAVNCESAMDLMFGFNVAAAQNTVSTTTRWTAYAEPTINGTENADLFAGDYMRNNQGAIDTFGWSANCGGFIAVAANDDFGVSVTELSGSEGGGGSIDSNSGWAGVWGLNLDTLEDAGGSVTVNATTAALTLTEQQASIALSTEISAGLDALTLTAFPASISLGYTVETSTDALSLAGLQASIGLDLEISAGFEALTLTTFPATIETGSAINAGVHNLVLTEQQASIDLSMVVDAGVQVLSLTAFPASIDQSIEINAGVDTLSLQTFAASIDKSLTIEAGTQALSLQTFAAGIGTDSAIQANTHALTLTTYQASVDLDLTVSAGVDALSITEHQASIDVAYVVNATTDSLGLTTFPASIDTVGDVIIEASVANLALQAHRAVIYTERANDGMFCKSFKSTFS